MKDIEDFARNQHFAFDKDATKHYDYLSAFQDSIEGSDADAALYYLAVILKSGDLESVVRRLKDSAALDVGLADPARATQVITLANTALEIGLPRASTHVAMATILLAVAPRYDSAMQAYYQAAKDAEHPTNHPMPKYLQDSHYQGAAKLRGAGGMQNMFETCRIRLPGRSTFQRTWWANTITYRRRTRRNRSSTHSTKRYSSTSTSNPLSQLNLLTTLSTSRVAILSRAGG